MGAGENQVFDGGLFAAQDPPREASELERDEWWHGIADVAMGLENIGGSSGCGVL